MPRARACSICWLPRSHRLEVTLPEATIARSLPKLLGTSSTISMPVRAVNGFMKISTLASVLTPPGCPKPNRLAISWAAAGRMNGMARLLATSVRRVRLDLGMCSSFCRTGSVRVWDDPDVRGVPMQRDRCARSGAGGGVRLDGQHLAPIRQGHVVADGLTEEDRVGDGAVDPPRTGLAQAHPLRAE